MSIELLRKEPTIRLPESARTLTQEVDVPAEQLEPFLEPVTDIERIKAGLRVRLVNTPEQQSAAPMSASAMPETAAMDAAQMREIVQRVSERVEQQMSQAIDEALTNAALDIRSELTTQLHLMLKKALHEELSQRNPHE